MKYINNIINTRILGFAIFYFFMLLASDEIALSQDSYIINPFPEISTKENKKQQNIQRIELLTGFGLAKLRLLQGNYCVNPMFVELNFDLKRTNNISFPGLLQFVLEPFASHVSEPNNNMEIGNNFLVKIGLLPENFKLQPYLKGGAGIVYLTQHTQEQNLQLNFNKYAGIGVHCFFNKNAAFAFEYRYRHLSSAGLKAPNRGINTNFTLGGVTYYF